MTFSLFIREHASTKRGYRWRFNPYVVVGAWELCIDSGGFYAATPRRSFGFIRKSGFWHQGYRA